MTSNFRYMKRATAIISRSPSTVVLRSRDFSALWFASNFADIGYNLRTMAQAWLIAELFDSQFWVGMANGLSAGPVVVFALFSGAFIDRLGGRSVLIIERVALAFVAALTVLLIYTELIQLWHIIVLGSLASGMASFGRPATNTLVPDLVSQNHLLAANSLIRVSTTLGQGLGPALGGLLFAAYGLESPFLALIALYGLSIYLTLQIRDTSGSTESSSKPQPWGRVFMEIRDGIRYAGKTPVVRWLLILSLSVIFATTWFPAVPFYARDVLGVGEIGMGVLYGGFAIGGTVGAVIMSNIGNTGRRSVYLLLGALLRGGGMIVFAYSSNYLISIGAMVAMGVAASLWLTTIVTALQTAVLAEFRGRVMSLWAISMQMVPLGWMIGGVLGEWWGNETMLLTSGVLFIVLPIFVLTKSSELRQAN